MQQKKKQTSKENKAFKDKYFDFYDDIKHETKSKDIEW